MYGLGHLAADEHEFTVPVRRQTRRPDVRIHVCPLHDDEWASQGGLLATRPQRTAADLLGSREDPEAVAQVVADALRRGSASPGEFAAALAASAAAHGFRRRDGVSLLQWLLDLTGDPDGSRWIARPAPKSRPRRDGRRPVRDADGVPPRSHRPAESLTESSRWTMPQLQCHVAYDRLLERLYEFDRNWVVKGATALMARELGTRGTLDIDLYREISLAAAEADLRLAAAADIGDWFRFEVGAATPVSTVGVRLPVTSVIGTTTWARFHVDLIGSGLRMTGKPEHVPPLAENAIPEVVQHGYQAYPLVDHVADKVAATYERYGTAGRPSTRYRDLVDLLSIVTGASVLAADQITALVSEFDRTPASPACGIRRARPAPRNPATPPRPADRFCP